MPCRAKVERLGLHSAMIADHIAFPVESQSTYSYTLGGRHPSVGAIDASPLSPQEMRAHLEMPKQLTEAEGREFSALTISYWVPFYDAGLPSSDRTRRE